MCFQLYMNTDDKYKRIRFVGCEKCNYSFELGWGGKSKGTSCCYHHINNDGFCEHCSGHISDIENINCFHIAKKTWWERLTGSL